LLSDGLSSTGAHVQQPQFFAAQKYFLRKARFVVDDSAADRQRL
jgi:hypothetical protein